MSVHILNRQRRKLNTPRIKKFAESLLSEFRVRPEAELTILLCTDKKIVELHERYMGLSGPTDLLTFPQDAFFKAVHPESRDPLILGDIVISTDTAHRQAHENAITLDDEVAWLVAHGILHLAGYTHDTQAARRKMLREQKRLLTLHWQAA